MTQQTLKEALYWLGQGVTPIPCIYKTKLAAVKWLQWVQTVPSERLVTYWFEDTNYNLALLTGGPHHFTVADFDDEQRYIDWAKDNPELTNTRTIKSSRGYHLYYFLTHPLGQTFGDHERKIDIKGSGYVLAYPSIHPTGKRYELVNDVPPMYLARPLFLSSLGIDLFPPALIPPPSNSVVDGKDPVVDEIKRQVSVLNYVAQRTKVLKSSDNHQGRWYMARCFLHEDHDPSMWIDAQNNRWGCYSPKCIGFATKGRSWDIINLVAFDRNLKLGPTIMELWKALYGEITQRGPVVGQSACGELAARPG